MKTPITADVPPDILAQQVAKIPMGDLGEPEDIAYGATYLLSDEAKYVTGAELVVDGGWSVSDCPNRSAVRSLHAEPGGGRRRRDERRVGNGCGSPCGSGGG